MDLKNLVTKITSFTLIFFGLYQILLSLNAIFFIYPHLISRHAYSSLIIQEGLIEKALLLYAMMVTNGIYGIALLLKPSREVEIIHILFGLLLTVVSIIFITKTSFTTDPIFNFLKQLIIEQ